jgi:hypothetical protein
LYAKGSSILKQNEAVYNEELELVDGKILEKLYSVLETEFIGNLRSYVDITIKKKQRRNITKRKEKYSNIIANMNLGLIEVDQNERILANKLF